MDWLRTVSLYLPHKDCRALHRAAGLNAIDAARWRVMLFHAHKQRMVPTMAKIRKIKQGKIYKRDITYRQTDNVAVNYKRSGCTKIVSCIRYDPPYPVWTVFWKICGHKHCNNRAQKRHTPRHITMRFLTDINGFSKFKSTHKSGYGDYQLVELVHTDDDCITIITMLLPCEMLNHDRDSDCKIVDHYKQFK
jgi:hypothetical protein